MARKKRCAYATDLTDTQWALIAPLIPKAEPGGPPQGHNPKNRDRQL
jgi:transposase